MERLSADAKESVSKLIEKQSQEMLDLIAKRLSLGDVRTVLKKDNHYYTKAYLRAHEMI